MGCLQLEIFKLLPSLFRYEQGLEDYEEAVARVEHTKEEQRSSNNFDQIASLFSVLNTAWRKTSQSSKTARKVDTDETNKSNDTSLSTSEVNGIQKQEDVSLGVSLI